MIYGSLYSPWPLYFTYFVYDDSLMKVDNNLHCESIFKILVSWLKICYLGENIRGESGMYRPEEGDLLIVMVKILLFKAWMIESLE